ncbi:MAG: HmuY family protein [Chitinophagales bacterium]
MNNRIAHIKQGTRQALSLLLLLLALGLTGCFKEKAIAPPGNHGAAQTGIVDMGPGYADQFFFSLATNSVVSTNSRMAYDLMFECKQGRYYVWLNTAKFMSVYKTDKTDFAQVTSADTSNLSWKYELGAFEDDSNAIGKWWDSLTPLPVSNNRVYLVFLGLDAEGNSLGCIKLKINGFSADNYSISYAAIDDAVGTTHQIAKDDTRNYSYFTFNNGGSVVNIEPDKSTWDLCFTRYTEVFYEPYYLPYEVTGVLSNPDRVGAYMDSTINFDSFTIADFQPALLSFKRDAVGYKWKRFTIGGSGYAVLRDWSFFIKADEERFYKLHFVTFVKDGENGHFVFDYFRL